MMTTWDDTNSSTSKKEEENVAKLCLMVGSEKNEVTNYESYLDFSNKNDLEQAVKRWITQSSLKVLMET